MRRKKREKRQFLLFLVILIIFCLFAELYRDWGESGGTSPRLLYTGAFFHRPDQMFLQEYSAGNDENTEKQGKKKAQKKVKKKVQRRAFTASGGLNPSESRAPATDEPKQQKDKSGAKQKKSIKRKHGASRTKKKNPVHLEKISNRRVRVLLKTQGFSSFYHEKITLTSDKSFFVYRGAKKTEYEAGKKLSFTLKKLLSKKKTIIVEPEGDGKLQILSFTRQNRHPAYRGKFQIQAEKEGLLLVNELSLEEYLYAVVPSEMSTSSPLEALKAQAVCARTVAYNKLGASKYESYGADLDDSENCQVYNNIPEDEKSIRAVKETGGFILKKKNESILICYFSTSWGYIASGKEVWNTESEIEHLQSKFQITKKEKKKLGRSQILLSEESAFRSFIEDKPYQTYDSDSPWYRWQVQLSFKILKKRIPVLLEQCYRDSPNLILRKKKSDGTFVKAPYKEIGKVQKISVAKRTASGLVTELVIEGKKHTVKVCTQHLIRRVLAPLYEKITMQDGTKHDAMTLLPSAAFFLEQRGSGKKQALLIKGGGFGHGAGMSQWGAKTLAESGWSYKRILKHYYQGFK